MMLKKICSLLLSALLLQAAAAPTFASTTPEKDAARAEKIHAKLSKLGTGEDARVKLELQDETKLEGYLSEAGADSFVVNTRDGKTTTVPYNRVKKIRGNNLSTGAKIAISAGAAAAIVLTVLWHMYTENEQ
jgi:hypothetical protein